MIMKNLKRYAVGAVSSLALVAGAASAQTTSAIDVSGIVTVFAGVVAAAATLGAAWLAMKIGIKAYKFLAGTV